MTTSRQAHPEPTRARARATWALTLLCFVQFMLVVDDTVVNVALPSIRDDLGFSTSGLAWVVNGYLLTFGGLLLLGGRAGDIWGHRTMFVAGLSLFALASLVCALAQEPWQLVGGRFVQGVGGALVSPAALALITLLFPEGPGRAKALSIWGGIAALGGIVGYFLSGALSDLASWRWVFLINLPLAGAALLLVPRLVDSSTARRRERVDVPGAVLGTFALLALVYGLLRVPVAGWSSAGVLVPLAGAVLLGAAFVATEARTSNPLVPLRFLANRVRSTALGVMMLFTTALFGMFFMLTLHMQEVLGWSPLTAGAAYLPIATSLLIGMSLAPKVMGMIGSRQIMLLGCLLSAAGLALLIGVSPQDTYLADIAPSLVLVGLGAGLAVPALAMAGMSGTSEEDAGLASGMLNTVQQVGGAIGLALLVGLASARTAAQGSAPAAEAATSGFRLAFIVGTTLLVAAAVVAFTAISPPTPPSAPQATAPEPSADTDERVERRI